MCRSLEKGISRRWRRFFRLAVLSLAVTLAVLLAACAPAGPAPASTPDESDVQTRVAATLTALVTATGLPPALSPTPIAPPPTEAVSPPTPTSTPVPPPTATPTLALPTPTHTPIPVITDWRGEYYDNRDLAGPPALVRNDVAVDFNWGWNAPAAGLPADDFSARWTRYVDLGAETYRFHVLVDDGVRLWVDGRLLINAWYPSGAHEMAVDYATTRGSHSMTVEYYEQAGEAVVRLWWERLAAAPSYPDWKAEYWSNRDLRGAPVLVRNDGAIDFNWGRNAPASGVPADNFSVRWTRTAGFDAATYRFHVAADDGVRLWVDDQLILDRWVDQSPRERTADQSLIQGEHRLRVEYYEHSGDATVRLWWDKIAAPSYADWKGKYWPNRGLSGTPALVRNDAAIDFRWGADAPAPGLPVDNFSVRWTRQLDFEAGIYRFYAWADDGIRFYVDDDEVIDEWRDSGEDVVYTADRTLAGTHKLKVEYYERGGEARVSFWWERVRRGPERQ